MCGGRVPTALVGVGAVEATLVAAGALGAGEGEEPRLLRSWCTGEREQMTREDTGSAF